MKSSQTGQPLGIVVPPVRCGALSIAGGSSGVKFEVGHDQLYASSGRPKVKAPGIASIEAISLFYLLLSTLCGFGVFIAMLVYFTFCSSIDCCDSLICDDVYLFIPCS